jgi:hypothetical protein
MYSAASVRTSPNPEREIRARWLVSLSLYLVIFIEVVPMEAGLANIAILTRSFFVWLALKLTCLTLILLPLLIYVALNGNMGMHFAWRRMLIIGTIITTKLILELPYVVPLLSSPWAWSIRILWQTS